MLLFGIADVSMTRNQPSRAYSSLVHGKSFHAAYCCLRYFRCVECEVQIREKRRQGRVARALGEAGRPENVGRPS